MDLRQTTTSKVVNAKVEAILDGDVNLTSADHPHSVKDLSVGEGCFQIRRIMAGANNGLLDLYFVVTIHPALQYPSILYHQVHLCTSHDARLTYVHLLHLHM